MLEVSGKVRMCAVERRNRQYVVTIYILVLAFMNGSGQDNSIKRLRFLLATFVIKYS